MTEMKSTKQANVPRLLTDCMSQVLARSWTLPGMSSQSSLTWQARNREHH